MSRPILILAACLSMLGCVQPPNTSHPVHAPPSELGAPLSSEEGQVKLAVLEYLSDQILKDSSVIRFVPLNEAEIKSVRGQFRGEIVPAERASFTKPSGWTDKITKQRGTLLYVGPVRIDGSSASASGVCARYSGTEYLFELSKEGEHWTVRSFKKGLVVDPL